MLVYPRRKSANLADGWFDASRSRASLGFMPRMATSRLTSWASRFMDTKVSEEARSRMIE